MIPEMLHSSHLAVAALELRAPAALNQPSEGRHIPAANAAGILVPGYPDKIICWWNTNAILYVIGPCRGQ